MTEPQPVRVPDTEQHVLTSANVGDTFDIFVALPRGYRSSGDAYPVLYLLDANGVFGMTTETLRVLDFFGEICDVIVVGIGYAGAASFPATMGRRTRDFTPTDEGWYVATYDEGTGANGNAGEGRAAEFLAFLSDELMPFVEHVSGRRMSGRSLGTPSAGCLRCMPCSRAWEAGVDSGGGLVAIPADLDGPPVVLAQIESIDPYEGYPDTTLVPIQTWGQRSRPGSPLVPSTSEIAPP